MRSLRERLAQFDTPLRAVPAPGSARSAGEPLAGLFDAGAVWVGEPPRGHLRIECALENAPAAPWEMVPTTAWRLMGVPVPAGDHWVVLDTETTGLASGTGTLVFLVGLVHWTSRGANRVQLFLPEPAGELGLLEALGAELEDADALLSYNGRGFDVPRLRSRLRLQRLVGDPLERPHLDLLFPARRLLRHRFADLRLSTLERELLGGPRVDDLPGEFAPEVYRSLLADRCDTGLREVLLHNARDVENLPALAAWLAAALTGTAAEELAEAISLEVARIHALRGDRAGAEALLRKLCTATERSVRGAARRELAVLFRRMCRFEDAAALWRVQIEEYPSDLRARIELAKLCEHRLHDLEAAQVVVLDALRIDRDRRTLGLQHAGGAPSTLAAPRDDLGLRLSRIRRKIRRGSRSA